MSDLKPWEVVNSRYVHRSAWVNLRVDHVALPDGGELDDFHVIEYPDWACVLCLTEAGSLLMVEQYRHGVGRLSLELPAGRIDAGEEPLAAAQRELREETGYEAEAWTVLGRCAPNPSTHTNYAYLFVAHGARRAGPPQLDESEALRLRLLDPAEALGLADRGEVLHGIHQTALFWAQHRGLLASGQ